MTCGKSVKTLASEYDVGKGYIYKELNNGNLKATKFGRKTIITAEQEKAWAGSKTAWVPVGREAYRER